MGASWLMLPLWQEPVTARSGPRVLCQQLILTEVGVPVTGVRGIQGGLPAHMPHRIALSSLPCPVIKQPFKVVLSSRLLPLSMLVVWRGMLPMLQRMLPQRLLLGLLRLLI